MGIALQIRQQLPDKRCLVAELSDNPDFSGIWIFLQSADGSTREQVCFVEYNKDRAQEMELCIGAYNSEDDEPAYYESYLKASEWKTTFSDECRYVRQLKGQLYEIIGQGHIDSETQICHVIHMVIDLNNQKRVQNAIALSGYGSIDLVSEEFGKENLEEILVNLVFEQDYLESVLLEDVTEDKAVRYICSHIKHA